MCVCGGASCSYAYYAQTVGKTCSLLSRSRAHSACAIYSDFFYARHFSARSRENFINCFTCSSVERPGGSFIYNTGLVPKTNRNYKTDIILNRYTVVRSLCFIDLLFVHVARRYSE